MMHGENVETAEGAVSRVDVGQSDPFVAGRDDVVGLQRDRNSARGGGGEGYGDESKKKSR
jgi:hypothetical protein